MGHICDGVADQNNINGLNTLVIWNNRVTHQSMPALSRALVSCHSVPQDAGSSQHLSKVQYI